MRWFARQSRPHGTPAVAGMRGLSDTTVGAG